MVSDLKYNPIYLKKVTIIDEPIEYNIDKPILKNEFDIQFIWLKWYTAQKAHVKYKYNGININTTQKYIYNFNFTINILFPNNLRKCVPLVACSLIKSKPEKFDNLVMKKTTIKLQIFDNIVRNKVDQ